MIWLPDIRIYLQRMDVISKTMLLVPKGIRSVGKCPLPCENQNRLPDARIIQAASSIPTAPYVNGSAVSFRRANGCVSVRLSTDCSKESDIAIAKRDAIRASRSTFICIRPIRARVQMMLASNAGAPLQGRRLALEASARQVAIGKGLLERSRGGAGSSDRRNVKTLTR